MSDLGLEDAEGRGIEYEGLSHAIVEAVQQLQDRWENMTTKPIEVPLTLYIVFCVNCV